MLMWVFGLSTTFLLLGLWGRAVSLDQPTVAESAATVVDADIARDRVLAWVEDAMVQAGAVEPDRAALVLERVEGSAEMRQAIDNVVDEFVAALFAPSGEDPTIDIGAAIAPAVPVITAELEAADAPVDDETLGDLLAATAMELDTGEAAGLATIVREARSFVTQAVLLALAIMLASGTGAVLLADERYAMLRTLAVRVLLSALSFAVFFRIGGWALDPSRGRSPVIGGTSILLGSNGHVFLIAAVAAALVATGGGWIAWNRKRRPVGTNTPTVAADDDTRELVSV